MPLSLFHLHGDLKDIRFARILATLRKDRFTGVFQVTTPAEPGEQEQDPSSEITREIQFADGHVAWAISTDKHESLRSFLQREHNITDQQWSMAEERAHEGTLRQALSDLGLVDPSSLEKIERSRADAIVLELFSAAEGEYRIRERQLSPGTPDLGIDSRTLILRGIVERTDRGEIMEEIGSLATVYDAAQPPVDDEGLKLPGEFQSLLGQIDGERSIGQICSATSLPDHYACSLFAALSMIGAIRKVEPRQAASSEKAAPEDRPTSQPTPIPATFSAEEPAAEEGRPTTGLEEELDGDEEPPGMDEVAEEETVPEAAAGDEELCDEDVEIQERPLDPEPATEMDRPLLAASEESGWEPSSTEMPLDDAPPSAYGDYGNDRASRPWLLLGGAAAVGIAALFIILMYQDRGDASERLSALPVLEDPLADGPEYAETPEPQENERVRSVPTARREVVAPPTKPNIPTSGDNNSLVERGRRSLELGNLRSAASYFDRALESRTGRYTIKLLTACQAETINRAVSEAGNRDDLFILSTTFEGKSCYRMFWGSYDTPERATRALSRDVPAFFRRDRNPPRVVPLDKM